MCEFVAAAWLTCGRVTNEKTEIVKALAEKIRNKIEAYDFAEAGKITASFGVTHCLEDDNRETIIKRADKALYKAKEHGRNRVELISGKVVHIDVIDTANLSLGYACQGTFICGGGQAAVKLLKAKQFDIVFTGMKMPDGGGMWLVSQIHEELHQIPQIYLCSGYNDILANI